MSVLPKKQQRKPEGVSKKGEDARRKQQRGVIQTEWNNSNLGEGRLKKKGNKDGVRSGGLRFNPMTKAVTESRKGGGKILKNRG